MIQIAASARQGQRRYRASLTVAAERAYASPPSTNTNVFASSGSNPSSRNMPACMATGQAAGIGLYVPVIVKYRDEKTDTAVQLEELLR